MISKKMRFFYFCVGILFIGICPLNAANLPDGSWVILPSQGRWQVFDLSSDWIERNAKPRGVQAAYIGLLPAHPLDVFNPPSPCSASSRIVFVSIDNENRVKSRQLSCVESGCEDQKLWGYQTLLEGLTVTILKNDSVKITKVFRKGAFSSPSQDDNPEKVSPMAFEKDSRIRSTVYSPEDLFGSQHDLGSCLGR